MRIQKSGTAATQAGVASVQDTGPVQRTVAPRPARPVQEPVDVTSIMGISEAELTPKVRAAIGQLMAEVHSLREELTRASKRIGYLEQLADKDPLLPVMNRRAFVAELARMIAFAERYDAPGSVLYFDIDGMKRVNDDQGHGAGDAVLRHVAEILLREVRASDVVGRLGGDEFGVILAQTDPKAAADKASWLARAIESGTTTWNGQPLDVGISYGVYTFAGGEEVDEALNAADQAMYARKRNGDNPGPED